MANVPQTYQRLTRNAAGVGTYSSLWLAEDHLMIVTSSGYRETYARLQLADIRGIFLTATQRRTWWGMVWGIIGGTALIVVAIALDNGETPLFSAFFLGLGVTGVIWNHLLGAGCRVHVLTGVQTAELPALVRRRKTGKVLARIEPLIIRAQADLAAARPPVPVPAPVTASGVNEPAATANAEPPPPPAG